MSNVNKFLQGSKIDIFKLTKIPYFSSGHLGVKMMVTFRDQLQKFFFLPTDFGSMEHN